MCLIVRIDNSCLKKWSSLQLQQHFTRTVILQKGGDADNCFLKWALHNLNRQVEMSNACGSRYGFAFADYFQISKSNKNEDPSVQAAR